MLLMWKLKKWKDVFLIMKILSWNEDKRHSVCFIVRFHFRINCWQSSLKSSGCVSLSKICSKQICALFLTGYYSHSEVLEDWTFVENSTEGTKILLSMSLTGLEHCTSTFWDSCSGNRFGMFWPNENQCMRLFFSTSIKPCWKQDVVGCQYIELQLGSWLSIGTVSPSIRHNRRATITAKTQPMPERTVFLIKAQATLGEIESVSPILDIVSPDCWSAVHYWWWSARQLCSR